MGCAMQTSLKILYWSMLIYEYEEVCCVLMNMSFVALSNSLPCSYRSDIAAVSMASSLSSTKLCSTCSLAA